MSFSVNEIQSLCIKAARGAGASSGCADRFGAAATRHLFAHRDARDLLTALAKLPLGPVATLPALVDGLLLLQTNVEVPKDATKALVESYVEALPFRTQQCEAENDLLRAQIDTSQPAVPIKCKRLEVPVTVLNALKTLAAKTYVPASDASRIAGAGAGLTDND